MSNYKIVVPRATTNLLTTPSFEVGTGGWASSGSGVSGTLTPLDGRNTARFTGAASASYIGRLTGGTYGSANDVLWFSAWIYVPASTGDWNSGNVSINFNNFTGATQTVIRQWRQGIDPREEWFFIVSKLEMGSDVTGDLEFVSSGTLVANDFIEVDCIQAEIQPDSYTTFCSGDQEDCFWNGAKGASTSTRLASSRAGGVVFDLKDDLGFNVESMRGAGFPTVQNVFRDRALVDGQEFLRTKVKNFSITLSGLVAESSLSNYHSARQQLIEAMKPDDDGGTQPFILQYHGAGDIKEIKVRLDAGLEQSKGNGFSERFYIKAISDDAYWKRFGAYTEILFGNTTDSSGGIVRRSNLIPSDSNATAGQWDDLGLTSSSHTTFSGIFTILFDDRDGKIYVGGNFTGFAGVTGADYIAAYDIATATWELVGSASDVNDNVDIIIKRPQGGIYIGGAFTSVAAVSNNAGFCAWTGSAWVSVPATTGTSGSVGTNVKDAVIGKDEKIYVCGAIVDFAGVTNADGIAVFDPGTSSWGDIGSHGTLSTSLAVAPNGDIYFGGDWNFAASDGQAYNIARWDGSAWYVLGAGITGGVSPLVEEIFVDENGDVYAGGVFQNAGGFSAINIAKWNGSTWAPLGSGVSGGVEEIIRYGSEIAVAFSWASGGTAGDLEIFSGLAFWDGSGWRGADLNHGADYCFSLANANGDLIAGFTGVEATIYKGVANTITTLGNAKAYPKFRFYNTSNQTREVVLQSIVNETTGAALYFNQRILDEEVIILDLTPGNRKMESSIFGRTWNILPSSDVVDFYIKPGVDNIITFYFQRDATGYSVENLISIPNVYWGID